MLRNLSDRAEALAWAVLLTVLAILGLVLFVLTIVSVVLIVVWVGLPLTVGCLMLLRQFASLHRRFAARMLRTEIDSAYLRIGQASWLRQPVLLARDPSTWRDLAWLFVNSTVGLLFSILAIVESIFGLIFWWIPPSTLLRLDAHLIAAMLTPSETARLGQRVQQLTESRAETVDTQAAELRRIERDLHDGAQARLVSLGMSLGLAHEQIEADPEQARQLIAEALETNTAALVELRDLVRGIHPPVLADRGLVGAVQALVLATPVDVTLRAELPGRLTAPVESAAYFAVAETLANVLKHSGSTTARIDLQVADDLLTIVVADDGCGGADISRGSGLAGIQRRLAAFDGTLALTSPVGGPTSVRMTLPYLPARTN
ncbi:Signal transduction histidine kinase [Frankineae bacterium MT45]|nr:Signal transduction histidine kinase [Frankineae bacterium MT45]